MLLKELNKCLTPDIYEALKTIKGFNELDPDTEVIEVVENGNYTIIYLADGTKFRVGLGDSLTPEHPECIDLTITKKCDYQCPFCYMGCTPDGKHAKLFQPGGKNLLDQIPSGTELAVNGNDLDHPDLLLFLMYASARRMITNITIRDYHFMKYFEMLKLFKANKLIHGIGVSFDFERSNEFIDRVVDLGPSVVIHVIAGVMSASQWNFLRWAGKDLNILILGYKDIGRGKDYMDQHEDGIKERCAGLERYLREDYKRGLLTKSFRSIAFDGLALEQLHVKAWMDPEEYKAAYSGGEGAYSFYLDLVDRQYSVSSTDPQMIPCGDLTIDEMFQSIRTEPLTNMEE